MKHILKNVPGKEGLSFCIVCKCAEGTLPAECPGERVASTVQEDIMNGNLEFIRGKWWTPHPANALWRQIQDLENSVARLRAESMGED